MGPPRWLRVLGAGVSFGLAAFFVAGFFLMRAHTSGSEAVSVVGLFTWPADAWPFGAAGAFFGAAAWSSVEKDEPKMARWMVGCAWMIALPGLLLSAVVLATVLS